METEVMNQEEEKQEEKAVVVRPKVNEALIGIAEDKATQLRKVFIPMLETLDGFEEDYNKILELEINEETCKLAKRLRLDIAKIRTNAAKAKKDQKAEFLRAGKAVDGIFHIVEYAVVSKEEKLKEIETHHERIETERKDALAVERIEELKKYDCDGSALGLGEMNETVWKNFLTGTKSNYETVKEAERKAESDRIEKENKAKQEHDRRYECSNLVNFISDFKTRIFSDLTEEEYKTLTTEAIKQRTAKEKADEEIRLENERLKKEADEREAKLEKEKADREAKEKKEREAREAKQEQVRKENQAKLDEEKRISDEKLSKERESSEKKRLEEKVKQDAILEKERKDKKRIQKKLDDEKALQDKMKKEEEKRLRDAELAPDKEKLRTLLIQFDALRGKISSSIAKTALENAYEILDMAVKNLESEPEWISIACICGKTDNYLPTTSGTVPCSNTRCHKLLDVGKK